MYTKENNSTPTKKYCAPLKVIYASKNYLPHAKVQTKPFILESERVTLKKIKASYAHF